MSKHLKRLNAPRTLAIHRKKEKWAVKSSPGSHAVERSIPLGIVLRDYLKLADTMRETKRVISNGEILVDSEINKNYKHPVGLMDVISIPKMKKDYRVLFDQRGKLVIVPISSKDAKWKLCRIENKKTIKGKKTQINFHDGRNKIVEKDEYKTGDTLKIDFKNQEIKDKFELKKGTISIIIGGSHIGEIANIDDIKKVESSKSNIAVMKGKNDFTTIQEYVFPIGKTKPEIELPEVKIK